LVAAFLVLAAPAAAVDLTVGCTGAPAGTYDHATITDALNALLAFDLDGPHSITVSGTCEENVQVFDRERLTLQAPEAATATIDPPGGLAVQIVNSRNVNLFRLTLANGGRGLLISGASNVLMEDCVVENHSGFGIQVLDASHLTVANSTVRNNGGRGINAERADVLLAGNVTIENNGIGLRLAVGARGRLDGFEPGQTNTIQGNGAGVVVNYSSGVVFNGQNNILNNGVLGVQLAVGSGGVFIGAEAEDGTPLVTRIEGHSNYGLLLDIGSAAWLVGDPARHLIRNNGGAGTASDSGIYVATGSSLFVGQGPAPTFLGAEITNNTGPGILIEPESVVTLANSIISNNSGGGLRVLRTSTAKLDTGNVISGNAGSNVSCDVTSLVAGDLSGISNVNCFRVERTLGPPRPGRIQ
jgi:hypothetical protein